MIEDGLDSSCTSSTKGTIATHYENGNPTKISDYVC